MVKIIESYTAPNPKEYTYWVDLTSNPNKGVIKYFKGNGKWADVNDKTNDDQSKDIEQLQKSVDSLKSTKVDKVSGKELSSNDFTDSYKSKLDSIQGVPTGGTNGQVLKKTASGVAWQNDNNTTYNVATSSANGLMSSADKSKLDGISAQANKYTLPAATESVLGGVKTGANITNTSGTISLTKANVTAALGYTPPTADTKVNVNNTLTSTSIVDALSAAQGKVLKDLIDALTARVSALETPAA